MTSSLSHTEDTDYRAPTGNFILQPGTRPRSCLPLTLLSDNLLEAQEELTGRIVGIVDQDGQVDQTPNRITFDPQETTVLINDDPNEGIVNIHTHTYTHIHTHTHSHTHTHTHSHTHIHTHTHTHTFTHTHTHTHTHTQL